MSLPIASFDRSIRIVPAIAYATTSGGDASQFVRTSWCTRPSKFLLPDSTDETTRSPCVIAFEISSGSGPELPMHVVQP